MTRIAASMTAHSVTIDGQSAFRSYRPQLLTDGILVCDQIVEGMGYRSGFPVQQVCLPMD